MTRNGTCRATSPKAVQKELDWECCGGTGFSAVTMAERAPNVVIVRGRPRTPGLSRFCPVPACSARPRPTSCRGPAMSDSAGTLLFRGHQPDVIVAICGGMVAPAALSANATVLSWLRTMTAVEVASTLFDVSSASMFPFSGSWKVVWRQGTHRRSAGRVDKSRTRERISAGQDPRLRRLHSPPLRARLQSSQAQCCQKFPNKSSPVSSCAVCSANNFSKSSTYRPVQLCSALSATSSSYGVTIGRKNSCPSSRGVSHKGGGHEGATRTLLSMTLFSGHATSTKHSISRKLPSLAGLSFPTLIV